MFIGEKDDKSHIKIGKLCYFEEIYKYQIDSYICKKRDHDKTKTKVYKYWIDSHICKKSIMVNEIQRDDIPPLNSEVLLHYTYISKMYTYWYKTKNTYNSTLIDCKLSYRVDTTGW